MMLQIKTERDNESLKGGKEVISASFSLTVNELREDENTQTACCGKLLTLCNSCACVLLSRNRR